MFSQAFPQTQVVAALSQVSTIVGHLRHGLSATSFPKGTPRPESTVVTRSTHTNSQQRKGNSRKARLKKKASANLDVNECISLLLKEENLSKILPLLVVAADSGLQSDIWSTSYVSSNTFYENRTGFPERSLEPSESQIKFLAGLSRRPTLTGQTPVFYEQRRFYVEGFGRRKIDPPSSKKATNDAEAARLIGEAVLNQVGSETKGGKNESNQLKIIRIAALIIFTYLVFRSLMTVIKKNGPAQAFLSSTEFEAENVTVTFDDVRGVEEAKQELQDAVEFLKHPEKFREIGAKLPKGVLLVGKPGVGKTLLAKAVAGEAGVPYFYASGASFDEMFVGTGAMKVRKLFTKAKQNAPCVIFIDEIDSVGAKRTSSSFHPYANQTINQLLSDMDGFNSTSGIIILAATNKRGNLDEALLRPGRFDVEVNVMAPDTKGREDIYNLYLGKVLHDRALDVRKLAEASVGLTGAEISNVVNTAARSAAIAGEKLVTYKYLDEALDKSRMGPSWKKRTIAKKELECTAYHEAGHTLLVLFTEDAPKLNKVTILPRGNSLGHTSYLPDSDSYSQSKIQFLATIDIALGGRVAEELMYGPDRVTSGASSDFQAATNVARSMVKQFGMSEKVGFQTHNDSTDGTIKLNETSPEHQQMIDKEVDRILNESYERTKVKLTSHKKELERLAKALLKYGTLDREEVLKVIKGQNILREPDAVLKDRNISSI